MESRFEPAAAIRDVLMDSAIGLWCVELDKGKAPRRSALRKISARTQT